MNFSRKETSIAISWAVALMLIRVYFNLTDGSFPVTYFAALLVLILIACIPLFIARAKRKKYQEWIEHFDGRITFNKNGLFITKPEGGVSIGWNVLTKVELTWEENPFGDPQFGPYCDTDWVLWSSTGDVMRITESVNETNSEILLEAFTTCLPDFNFDYAKFREDHRGRLYDLKGGSVTVWERNA